MPYYFKVKSRKLWPFGQAILISPNCHQHLNGMIVFSDDMDQKDLICKDKSLTVWSECKHFANENDEYQQILNMDKY